MSGNSAIPAATASAAFPIGQALAQAGNRVQYGQRIWKMSLEQQLVQLVANATKIVAKDLDEGDMILVLTKNGVRKLPLRQLNHWIVAQAVPPVTPSDNGNGDDTTHPLEPGDHVYV